LIDTYWTNIFRVPESDLQNTDRPVVAAVVDCDAYLTQGTYWLVWMMDGSSSYAGPWVPPISILGETYTGNGMQYVSGWSPVMDGGQQQGFPFIVQGTVRYSLWNQSLSQVNKDSLWSQEFPDYPNHNIYLADDFYIHSQWKINYIFVPGDRYISITSLFDADALHFMLFEDNGGVPAGDPEGGDANPIWSVSLAPTHPNVDIYLGSNGLLTNTLLKLPNPVILPKGRYWLVFYPTLMYDLYGGFGRQSADTPYGFSGQIINPRGGFGWGTAWQDWRNLSSVNYDSAFRLGGWDIFTYLPLINK
jgi:hypothetical protein